MQSKKVYAELNAFMGKLRDTSAHDMMANMQAGLDYQSEKIRILEEKLSALTGREHPELNDDDRRRLARRAHAMNTSLLEVVENDWEPETVLGWYRDLIAAKYTSANRGRGGRSPFSQEIIEILLKMAERNPNWGYLRLSNYMKYIGHSMCEKTVRRILNSYGIYPRNDDRKHSWNVFFESHKEVMAACDFATYELATENGLQREHILFFENIATREVWCGGIAHEPDSNWMAQVARNQTDAIDGRLNGMKYIVHDRDPLFQGRFTEYLKGAGCRTKMTPPRTPEMNGYIESFIRTIRRECLDHLILTSERQLRYVVDQYLIYYNRERPHSGLGGAVIRPWPQDEDGEVTEFSRLGGLLVSYRKVKRAS